MLPVLDQGDRLIIVDCPAPRPGDVIIFSSYGEIIAHRVRRVRSGVLITQGDNNPEPDSEHVQSADILGRVEYALNRNGKMRRIYGGKAGRILGFLMRKRACAVGRAEEVYGSVYRSSPLSGLQPFLLPWMRVRVFPGSDGDELHLFLGTRNIGIRRSGSSLWRIKRPFRLIFNDSYLSDRFR